MVNSISRAALAMSLVLGLLVLSATVHAAPFAYITNAGDNTVSVIDTATNKLVATHSVGAGPNGVTYLE